MTVTNPACWGFLEELIQFRPCNLISLYDLQRHALLSTKIIVGNISVIECLRGCNLANDIRWGGGVWRGEHNGPG
jgi:hypothetical protein